MSIILSIDPGQHNLGYVISRYSDDILEILEHGTFHPHEAWRKHPELKKYGKYLNNRTLNGREISVFIKDMINKYNPDYIVSEDAFYNTRRPQAYVSLLICIYAIESTLYSILKENDKMHISSARLFKLPPKSVKRVVHDGTANKDNMLSSLDTLISNNKIIFVNDTSILTEHEVDAICIGYAFTKIWLPIIVDDVLPTNITTLNKTTKKMLSKKKYRCKYIY